MNPYEVLGVRKNATPAQIKRAHRRRAMETHPDRGGSPEDFSAVTLAWKVLSDEKHRAHFDRTGEMPDTGPNRERQMLLTMLSLHVMSIVAQAAQKDVDIGSEDFLGLIRESVDHAIRELGKQLAVLENQKRIMREAMKRFITTDEENVIVAVLQGHIDQVNRNLAGTSAEIDRNEKVRELLKTYKWRKDEAKQLRMMWSSATATSATNWQW